VDPETWWRRERKRREGVTRAKMAAKSAPFDPATFDDGFDLEAYGAEQASGWDRLTYHPRIMRQGCVKLAEIMSGVSAWHQHRPNGGL